MTQREIRSWLMDMDGVLVHEEQAIPGADRFLAALRERGIPHMVLTNNSIYTRRDLAARLRASGLEVAEESIWTSALATARFLEDQRPGGSAFVIGESGLADHDPGGLEPLAVSTSVFAERLQLERRTLKRALTDPRLFSGIGNAYSDEILHAAQLSPLQWTSNLSDDEIARLHAAVTSTLLEWTERLRAEMGTGFPEKVTAFRADMAVHGKFGQPCPRCGSPVQHIVYAANECNYCPTCQTGGRLLADRSLSRLLGDDWPRTLEELEERKK